MKLAVSVALFFLSISAQAYTPFKRSLDEKKNVYMTDGVFTGGKASPGGVSLLNVHRAYSKVSKIERVTLDLGDKKLKPLGKGMGFFQASLDSRTNRLEIDIPEFNMTRVSERQLRNLFKKSQYIKTADMTLDPEDRSATIVLQLKQPMRLEVFQNLKDKAPARIVMDLVPAAPVKPDPKAVDL